MIISSHLQVRYATLRTENITFFLLSVNDFFITCSHKKYVWICTIVLFN